MLQGSTRTLGKIFVLVLLLATLLAPAGLSGCQRQATPPQAGDDGAAGDTGGSDAGTGSDSGDSSGASGSGDTGGTASGDTGEASEGAGLPPVLDSLSDVAGLAPGYALLYELNQQADPGVILPAVLSSAIPWNRPAVTLTENLVGGVAWGPDGRAVFGIVKPPDAAAPSLVLTTPDGSSSTVLARLPGAVFSHPHTASLSPDGQYVAIMDGTSVECNLHILSRAGNLVDTLSLYGGFVWAPDSTGVAFAAPEELANPIPIQSGYSSSLGFYDIATGETTLLVQGDETYMILPDEWDDQDSLIYWKSNWANYNQDTYWRMDPANPGAEHELVSSGPRDELAAYRALIPGDLADDWTGQADYSPDGTALAIVCRDEANQCSIYVIDPESGAYGLVGEGDCFYWSPVPIVGAGG